MRKLKKTHGLLAQKTDNIKPSCRIFENFPFVVRTGSNAYPLASGRIIADNLCISRLFIGRNQRQQRIKVPVIAQRIQNFRIRQFCNFTAAGTDKCHTSRPVQILKISVKFLAAYIP